METASRYNNIQQIKRHFFAMRNGIIADALRKGGSPFRIIFGLNLPQLADIAAETGKDPILAEELWKNTTTRESMLLAPMLIDPSSFSREDATRWIAAVPSREVADILCHKLLRHVDFAWELAESLTGESSSEMEVYTGLRLAYNLVSQNPAKALELAEKRKGHPLAASLSEEASFFLS